MSKITLTDIQQTRSAIMQTPEMVAHIKRWGFSFARAKVLVTNCRDEFLVVEEKRARIDGIWQDVHDIWNFPSGSLDNPTEDIFTAACREVREETGYVIELTGFLGVDQSISNRDPCFTFMFLGKCKDNVAIGKVDEREIWRAVWLTERKIRDLAEDGKMRSTKSNIYMLDWWRFASKTSMLITHQLS